MTRQKRLFETLTANKPNSIVWKAAKTRAEFEGLPKDEIKSTIKKVRKYREETPFTTSAAHEDELGKAWACVRDWVLDAKTDEERNAAIKARSWFSKTYKTEMNAHLTQLGRGPGRRTEP